MAMDYLKIALSEVAAISERRIFRLTDGKSNAGLPPMLTSSEAEAGLHSGLMMPHYTAVSLVLENQHLAAPDSIHSLPTSGGKEDHNANSMTDSDKQTTGCVRPAALLPARSRRAHPQPHRQPLPLLPRPCPSRSL